MLINKNTLEIIPEYAYRRMFPSVSLPEVIGKDCMLIDDIVFIESIEKPSDKPGMTTVIESINNDNGTYSLVWGFRSDTAPNIYQDPKMLVTTALNKEALSRDYENIDVAVSYAGYDNIYQEEGIQFGKWRSAMWMWFYKNKDLPNFTMETAPKFEDFNLETPNA